MKHTENIQKNTKYNKNNENNRSSVAQQPKAATEHVLKVHTKPCLSIVCRRRRRFTQKKEKRQEVEMKMFDIAVNIHPMLCGECNEQKKNRKKNDKTEWLEM